MGSVLYYAEGGTVKVRMRDGDNCRGRLICCDFLYTSMLGSYHNVTRQRVAAGYRDNDYRMFNSALIKCMLLDEVAWWVVCVFMM